jgi:hypothetical protein
MSFTGLARRFEFRWLAKNIAHKDISRPCSQCIYCIQYMWELEINHGFDLYLPLTRRVQRMQIVYGVIVEYKREESNSIIC